MKVLILIPCFVSAVLAGWIPSYGHEHIPIIHDGVPVDTPEVQHAKAEHFEAVEAAKYHVPLDHGLYDDHGHSSVDYAVHHGYHHTVKHSEPAYYTSYLEPVIGHDGKPLDTPEVEQAKADHFAAVHEALSRTPPHDEHHYRKRRGIEEYGLSLDHVGLDHYGGDDSHSFSYHQVHAPVYGHHYDHHSYHPGVDHKGRPLDTPEVEEAKAKHLAAHIEAKLRNAAHAADHHGYASQLNYGGPKDTPEVAHAKFQHFAAHAAASVQHLHH